MNQQADTAAELIKVGGGIIGGGLGLGWLARFAFRKMTEEGAATQRAAGETDVIHILRDEVDRLSQLNGALSAMVGDLQQQVIILRAENGELKSEIHALGNRLKALNGEPAK